MTNGSKTRFRQKNLNLNFELSDDMKALFKSPNDKALN
ncbi:Glutamate Aspartate periplasmic binding protein precursor GltI (TC 3.A.1.3.4) [Klebsiella pneumoniae IS53]|uniref:Glutamate Aspartate periplasmic binding protein GltI (TC 3.A.1.3.4) n=1 Tax=Klebsiella pneumoniae IS43 TaxID=1432552 RepID=W1DDU0_KLEPN|nr:Glutamate Aspartate periplasmic binding protein precursor GltI (TC 3.A.1.3.4) [Klebsiella pneumoniae IS43]CDL23399.1 Glutamate Aspartate periplasmic binding protein precursor GltI (TC 3.A.1.3.4) [Klebsiella pneumoniae IS53]